MNGFDEDRPPAEGSIDACGGAIAEDVEIPLARPITVSASFAAVPTGDAFALRTSRSSTWWDMTVLLVCLVGFRVAAEIGLSAAAPVLGLAPVGAAMDSDEVRRAVVVPVLFVSAIAAWIIIGSILRYRRQDWSSVGLTRRRIGTDAVIGLVAMAAAYLLIGAALLVMSLIVPSVMEKMNQNATNLITVLPKLSPALLALLSLAIGYYEELVFRGFLMTRLRRCAGGWIPAVVLTTALFTSLHASVQLGPALVFISLLSLVLSVVTIWRRSVVPAIVAHATFDFSQFMLLYFTSGDAWK